MDTAMQKTCIWVHHIATFIGLCTGVYHFIFRKDHGAKQSLLVFYIASQIWAVIKILAGFGAEKGFLQKSYDNIHTLCENKKQEKRSICILTGFSAMFKIGTPILLK